jgi:hypothetical protein
MLPVQLPDRCLLSEESDNEACRIGGGFWRERSTGPRHPLRVVRCRAHNVAFTLYPEGYLPYGRMPVLSEADEAGEVDMKASLVGAAIAAAGGQHWPEDLIDDEQGPVGRTQRRRIKRLGMLVGFDRPQVESAVLGELGLNAIDVGVGSLAQRVAALSKLGTRSGSWLRLVAAIDHVGLLGSVWVMPKPTCDRLSPSSGALARAMRDPPFEGKPRHESVLESSFIGS